VDFRHEQVNRNGSVCFKNLSGRKSVRERPHSTAMMFAPDLTGTRVAAPALPMDQPMPKGAKKKEQLPEEMLAMRDYTLGDSGMSRSDGTVLLHVSHSNLKQTFFHELRLDMHSTVEAVKRKLEFHTGTSAMNCQVRWARKACCR
jgi:hypothetical protein